LFNNELSIVLKYHMQPGVHRQWRRLRRST
jgi:hypothetical protein